MTSPSVTFDVEPRAGSGGGGGGGGVRDYSAQLTIRVCTALNGMVFKQNWSGKRVHSLFEKSLEMYRHKRFS